MTTYQPGRSWLHRAPTGPKLAGIAAAMVVVVAFRTPLILACSAAVVVVLYLSCGAGLAGLGRQVRPMRWFVLGIVAVHAVTGAGTAAAWTQGLLTAGTLVVAVALAGLLTLTTSVTAMLDTVERALSPLRRVGVDASRVALVLALTIRSIPVIGGLAGQIRDALRARGRSRSVRAYAVPLVVRSLRQADALGEALVARGIDD